MATRWGIVSAGKIANDFANALSVLPQSEHIITVNAARKSERAEEFAAKYGIPKSYGNYQEMSQDPDFDVAYIAVVCPNHFKITKMFLEAGKHVLCEKPFAMTSAQVKEMVELARSKNLFLMEANWSRFLPLHQRVKEMVTEEKVGATKNIVVTFGQKNCNMPGRRLFKKEHGGGTVLDYGTACIQFILNIFGNEKPEKMSATSVGTSETGVDLGVSVAMQFKKGRVATFITDLRVDMPCEATIIGKEGSILIGRKWWCGTDLTYLVDEKIQTENFPLPGGAKYPFEISNGQGLMYQAEEVRKCLSESKTESSVMSLDESILIAELVEEINKQIGIGFEDVPHQE